MVLSCVSAYAQGQQAGFSRNGVPHLISKKQRILRRDVSLKHQNIIFILLPYLNHKYTHVFCFQLKTKLKVPPKSSYAQQNQPEAGSTVMG